MRIISKFHDYYDTAAGFGLDPSQVYRRVPEYHVYDERLWKWDPLLAPFSLRYSWHRTPIRSIMLGFCGRALPLWTDADLEFTVETMTSHLCASKVHGTDEALRLLREWSKSRETDWEERSALQIAKRIEEYAPKATDIRVGPEIFRDLQSPLLVIKRIKEDWSSFGNQIAVITNPRLATLGFQHVQDAFSTFQEIATFLGLMVTGEDQAPRTVGDDKVIAASKGFDEQSFRTQAPGSKKLNRRQNRLRKQGL